MITITHEKATFTVNPENVEQTCELLALIDKSKGANGRKLPSGKAMKREHNGNLRSYPTFYAGMTTAEYIRQYTGLNRYLFVGAYAEDKILSYTHADRPAPMLDPSIPEVEALPCEQ